MRKESDYQSGFIKRLKREFPDCIVLKNDANYIQGFPDLTLLFKDKWAALEVKRNKNAHHQPNQDYYVSKLNGMSYSSFVYPENEEEVLDGIRKAFGIGGSTLVP